MINFTYPMAALLAIPALLAVVLLVPRNFIRLPSLRLRGWLLQRVFKLEQLPRLLMLLGVIALGVALAGPTVQSQGGKKGKGYGRDFVLALDNSNSMGEKFDGPMPQLTFVNPFYELASDAVKNPEKVAQRRIGVGQAYILKFVERRMSLAQSDCTAQVTFAKNPHLSWPLDDDLTQIRRHGSFVPAGAKGDGLMPGTNFGKTFPGPIDMAADEFRLGQSKTRVLILLTDGEDAIDEKTMDRLVAVIKDLKIKLYVIGIGPKFADKDAPIQQLAKNVKGHVYSADHAEELEKCFDEIDQLESTPVDVEVDGAIEEMFWLALVASIILVISSAAADLLLRAR